MISVIKTILDLIKVILSVFVKIILIYTVFHIQYRRVYYNNIRELAIIQQKIKYILWTIDKLFTRYLGKIMCFYLIN